MAIDRPSESRGSPSVPLVEARDLTIAAAMLVLTPVAWLVPERFWPRLGSAAARLWAVSSNARSTTRLVESAIAGRGDLASPPEIYRSVLSGRLQQLLQNLREHRPGGWRPSIQVIGGEHIGKALARGNGAILWVAPCLYCDLVVKKGLYGAGFRISHLSRIDHGPADSRLGQRLLNPVRVNRINAPPDDGAGSWFRRDQALRLQNPIRCSDNVVI